MARLCGSSVGNRAGPARSSTRRARRRWTPTNEPERRLTAPHDETARFKGKTRREQPALGGVGFRIGRARPDPTRGGVHVTKQPSQIRHPVG